MKKMQGFKSHTTRGVVSRVSMTGYKFEHFGVGFIVHKESVGAANYWSVTELSTGYQVYDGSRAPNSRKIAVNQAINVLNKEGEEKTRACIKSVLDYQKGGTEHEKSNQNSSNTVANYVNH